jgi:septal ring-binding cell division protein DamX/type II secretory pathway predicted ATPase ExeA
LYADLTSVIVGQKGYGKTYLLEKLHARLDGQVYTSQIEADSVMTPAQLEKSISLQLGLSWQNSEQSLVDKINSSLEQRILLTVDDAHLLSLYCLDFLLGLVSQLNQQQNLIYIVLAGEANLAKKLNATPALKANPNLCVVFELQAIEEQETKLLISDYNSLPIEKVDILFDAQKITYFWQLSHGNPGELYTQLQRWMNETKSEGNTEQIKQEKLKPKRQYLLSAVYSIFALILVLALVFQDEINNAITPDITIKETPRPQKIKLKTKTASQAEVVSINETVDSLEGDNEKIKVESNDNEEKRKLEIDDNAVTSANELHMESLDTSNKRAIENTDGKTEVKLTPKDNVKQPSNISQPNIEVKVVPVLTADEEMLLAMDQAFFTLQWMGVSRLSSAEAFKNKHPQKDNMFIFRRVLKDKYLYVVVSGQYSSRVDAENTRAIYKKRGYPGSPWVKSLKAVQKEISEHDNK